MPTKPEEQSLSILTQGTFTYYAVTEHGITFSPDTPQNVWLTAIEQLLGMHEGATVTAERTLMLLADALNYGEKAWPHEFAQAIDGTRAALGLSPKTIANAQWVYGKIESSRRRDGLTLGHMSVIAALPEGAQESFMDYAIANHLTVSDLKTEVADRFPKTKRGKDRKKKVVVLEIKDSRHAKEMLNDLCLWLGLNEDSVDESFKPFLERIHKLYRRHWASGRAKK